jgi:hypothetical protein
MTWVPCRRWEGENTGSMSPDLPSGEYNIGAGL